MSDPREPFGSTAPRRGFIAHLVGMVAAVAAGVGGASALSAQGGMVQQDIDWMKSLTGRHRTVLDVGAHRNGKPLAQAKNYLDAWTGAFQVPESDVNLVLGIHGDALPIVLTDGLWRQFDVGALYEVADASTKGAAVRNVFTREHAAAGGLVSGEQTVDVLQRRGVQFIVCNNTITGATQRLVAAGRGSAEQIRPALLAGLLSGVRVVPAMVVALTQLQEVGLRYTKVA